MIYCIGKKTVICAAALIIAAAAAFGCTFSDDFATVFAGSSTREVPIYSVARDDKKIALTFDAAWGADKTEGILEILDDYGVKGTFFLVGFWIDKYPDEVKAIAESGCEIGNHSENHLQMSTLSREKIAEELSSVNGKIEELTGSSPRYFRAPFGDYDNELIEGARELGLTTVQWDVDSLDWKGLSDREIYDRVAKRVKNGSIVLFHNNSDNILTALPIVLAKLINDGYEPVTLSELIYGENYTVDNNGVQHKQ